MTRKNQFDPTAFDPIYRKSRMKKAAAKKTDRRNTKKPEANPPTSLPPDEDDSAKAEVDSTVAALTKKLEATEKKLKSYDGWTKKLRMAMAAVTTAKAEFEEADAARKAAKAAVDSAVARVLELDAKIANGEQLLPFDPTDTAPVNGSPAPGPAGNDFGAKESIESLSTKNIKKIAGKDVFDAARAKDEPIGLSDKQVETLIAADIKTIGDLEKRMREDEWWHKKLSGFGEKNVTRLVDTLLAFRQVYPVPAEPDQPASNGPAAGVKPVELHPQPEQWEQSAYHLRELIAECNALLETDIPDDGKQFCRSVCQDAEDMLQGVTEAKAVTDDQRTAIENWTNGVAKWRKPSN